MIVIRKDFSLFILFLCSIVYCEDKGIQLYNSNQFDKAREYYEKILLERKEDAIASFGLGSAAFQQNDLLSAMEGFESALNTDNMELKSNAYYNMGNVLVENQRLEEDTAFYRKSLELNPNDLDSKINYELVKIKLQEQQKERIKNQMKKMMIKINQMIVIIIVMRIIPMIQSKIIKIRMKMTTINQILQKTMRMNKKIINKIIKIIKMIKNKEIRIHLIIKISRMIYSKISRARLQYLMH